MQALLHAVGVLVVIIDFCGRDKTTLVSEIEVETLVPYTKADLHTCVKCLVVILILQLVVVDFPFVAVTVLVAEFLAGEIIADKQAEVGVKLDVVGDGVFVTITVR